MFDNENDQSEQTARFLINTISKAVKKGDLKSASRRIQRVKALTSERNLNRGTLGELLLIAAEVARACGKIEQANGLVMEILSGKGGIKMEIIGHAKRLRARLLLDEGKLDEAELMAETADRYILTGLMEEKTEIAAGREVRVNVQVEQKFLDNGQHVSVDTYLLRAEIAVLENNWEKVVAFVNSAKEKQDRDGVILPALEMWRGIVQMARGESFVEAVEHLIAAKDAPAVLVGRIEAILDEPRREDSPINEIEFNRFRRISELARQLPLKVNPNSFAEFETSDDRPEIAVKTANKYRTATDDSAMDSDLIIDANLSQMSMMQLVEIIDIEKVTGVIALNWNYESVRDGIEQSYLDKSAECGSGIIYCRDGRFIDAEFLSGETVVESGMFPDNRGDRSRFFLRQLLVISLGGGSELLSRIQSRKFTDINELKNQTTGELPKVTALVKRDSKVSNREKFLQVSSNLNFLLDVAKEIDELRNGFTAEDEDIDWDADWGTSSAQSNEVKAVTPVKVKSTDLKFDSLTNIIEMSHSTRFTGYLELTWKPKLYEEQVTTGFLPATINKGKGFLFFCEGNIIDAAIGDTESSNEKSVALENFYLVTQLAASIGTESIPCEITVEGYEYEVIATRNQLIKITPNHMIGTFTKIANRVNGIFVDEEEDLKEIGDLFGSAHSDSDSIDASVDAALFVPARQHQPPPPSEIKNDGLVEEAQKGPADSKEKKNLPDFSDDDFLLELD